MGSPNDLLKLSLAVQVALGSGYIAYLISYAGIRQHHSATDVVFRTLIFGLVASAVMTWTTLFSPLKLAAAVAAAVSVGALWRWRGMRWAQSALRQASVTWADDIPTAWLSISATRTDCPVSQIAVEMTDGRLLLCEDTRVFVEAPFGPCVLGLGGDVGLYVTDEMRPDGTWFKPSDVWHPLDGVNLTFVPAAQIKRVELRHWTKKLSASAAEAEVPATALEEAPGAT
jgi:hypothetical protein